MIVVNNHPGVLGVQGVVKVMDLKGLAERKDRPSTTYTLRKYIPQFGSVIGVSMGTKPPHKNP